jgi:hypothetical protein
MGNDGQERQIEMVWRCSTCQTRNLGRFVACTACGNPKDDSEEYEMPSDTDAAPSVTDPALLALATARENWRCRYCRSHQRRLDGACAACGASADEGGPQRGTASAATSRDAERERERERGPNESPGRRPSLPWRPLRWAFVAGLVVVFGCLVILVKQAVTLTHPPRLAVGLVSAHPRVVDALVSGRVWEHRVVIERWKKIEHEGFAESKPADAIDVRTTGQRQHHTERVLAGSRTETYSERVRDGDRTESYTTTESCGQDCTTVAPTCREVCSSNKNGFATCKQQCSGGGQRCTPKRCTVTKTRSVPQYRDVARTREIPVYKDEPRFAPYFAWNTWEWAAQRRLVKNGTEEPLLWPTEAELAPPDRLGPEEKERPVRSFAYTISARTSPDSEARAPLVLPLRDEAAFARASNVTTLAVYRTAADDRGFLDQF